MICKNCNKEIDDDSKFCSFCGNNLINTGIIETKIINENKTSIKEFYISYYGLIGRKEFLFRAFLPLSTLLITLITLFQILELFSIKDKLPKEILVLSYIIIGILWLIIQILIFVVVIKRLNDCNINTWLSILTLIPIINIFITTALFLIPSKNNSQYGNKSSNYKFNKRRWIILILEIILIIFAIFVFSFSKRLEIIELSKKQKEIEKYQRDYLGNYKAPVNNILINTLSADGREVYLMKISIQIKSKSPKIVLFVENNRAEIMDKAISLITLRTSDELLLAWGKELLRTDLIYEIKSISNDIDVSDLIFIEYLIVK